MPILSSVSAAAQPDYVALAMVLVLAVIVAVMTVRKYMANRNKSGREETAQPAAAPEAAIQKPAAPGSAGHLKIHDVPPKTAAMLMAIVADKTGKPLNELRFISIKEVK